MFSVIVIIYIYIIIIMFTFCSLCSLLSVFFSGGMNDFMILTSCLSLLCR